jgi:hypothetical protein
MIMRITGQVAGGAAAGTQPGDERSDFRLCRRNDENAQV